VSGVVAAGAGAATVGEALARTARVGLLGASGYSGREFLRLASAHPGLEMVAVGLREASGRPWRELFPGLDPEGERPRVVSVEELLQEVERGALEALVSALPHGAFAALLAERPAILEGEAIFLDLSGDHRAGEHGFVYGLPEAFRASLAGASRIANPGCYPTAAVLSLLPAARAGWLAGPVTVTALSGASGAGRAAELRTSFVELNDGASFYRAGGDHAHGAEMQRALSRLHEAAGPSAGPLSIAFVPQLVPMSRGILLTAVAGLAEPHGLEEARALYAAAYEGEPFVRCLAPGEWPETRAVRGSNRCDVSLVVHHGGRTLVAMAALDNLGKGAAGQALQNLNLALGWPETTGLTSEGRPW
jgi:N-acetyl-gamma-glutamyl-phosphate reductase